LFKIILFLNITIPDVLSRGIRLFEYLLILRGLCKTVLLSKFFPKVFGRFQNSHVLLIRCGFEITQALTLTKIPGFAKPSFKPHISLI